MLLITTCNQAQDESNFLFIFYFFITTKIVKWLTAVLIGMVINQREIVKKINKNGKNQLKHFHGKKILQQRRVEHYPDVWTFTVSWEQGADVYAGRSTADQGQLIFTRTHLGA